MRIVALVPARGGSVRIPNKNMQTLGELSLVERKVLQLKQCDIIDEVYVGSDSDDILEIAIKAGATPIKRNPIACDEALSPANVMIEDFSKLVNGDIGIWAHCTNPFIYGRHYKAAISSFLNKYAEGYDSLLSVFRVQSHMWNKYGFPVNYNPYNHRHTLAKEVDPFFFQDGGIFIQTINGFRESKYFFGRKPYLWELDFPASFDINTPEELDFAMAIYEYVDKLEDF